MLRRVSSCAVWLGSGWWIAVLGGLLLWWLLITTPVSADGPLPADNAACLTCHSDPTLTKKLPNGEILSLYVEESKFSASVHGRAGQTCQSCHTNITGFPHPAFPAADLRDASFKLYTSCQQCHQKQYKETLDSMHARALAAGQRDAPICTDCHTAHEVSKPGQPRVKIPQTCENCHSVIYNQYKTSVHGAALVNENNLDVPTCVDCHGVHNIGDPTTAAFRLKSPQLCASCHTDPAKMSKYNLSTNVLNSYVADFHGTTIAIFEKQSPDAASNKAVCYDCHGIHDILSAKDPNSAVFKDNLLKTCEQCHPDATMNSFVGSWMSHYDASPTKYPLVYYINLFYMLLIPLTIGSMIIYIAIDAGHRLISRLRRRSARHV